MRLRRFRICQSRRCPPETNGCGTLGTTNSIEGRRLNGFLPPPTAPLGLFLMSTAAPSEVLAKQETDHLKGAVDRCCGFLPDRGSLEESGPICARSCRESRARKTGCLLQC